MASLGHNEFRVIVLDALEDFDEYFSSYLVVPLVVWLAFNGCLVMVASIMVAYIAVSKTSNMLITLKQLGYYFRKCNFVLQYSSLWKCIIFVWNYPNTNDIYIYI